MKNGVEDITRQIFEFLDKNPDTTFLQVLDRLQDSASTASKARNPMQAYTGAGMLTACQVMRNVYERMHPTGGNDEFNAGLLTGVSVLAQVGAHLVDKIKNMPGPDETP